MLLFVDTVVLQVYIKGRIGVGEGKAVACENCACFFFFLAFLIKGKISFCRVQQRDHLFCQTFACVLGKNQQVGL